VEQTLVLIKPDGIERHLVGEIISRYERKNLKIRFCKLMRAEEDILERHYREHKGKDFYKDLVEYMQRGDILVLVLEGENAIEMVRKINGKTDPLEAEIGSIRGDLAIIKEENLVHASDSLQSAKKEIEIWTGR
jgi:nucleoside-diphosphate kinase